MRHAVQEYKVNVLPFDLGMSVSAVRLVRELNERKKKYRLENIKKKKNWRQFFSRALNFH